MPQPKVMKHGPKHPWYDNSRAPLIVMHFPESFNDTELGGALEAVKKWLLEEVDGLFGYVADFRRPLATTARQRSMMANAEKTYAHVDRSFNAGQAVVVPGSMSRGIITAIYWLSPPIYPLRTCATMEEAFAWLEPHFEQAVREHPHGPIWQRKPVSMPEPAVARRA